MRPALQCTHQGLFQLRGSLEMQICRIIERMVKMDLRVVALDVPKQEVITRDNVTVRVNAVCYFQVFNPENAVVAVQHYWMATSQMAQTTLRSVLGQAEFDQLLSEREDINHKLEKYGANIQRLRHRWHRRGQCHEWRFPGEELGGGRHCGLW